MMRITRILLSNLFWTGFLALDWHYFGYPLLMFIQSRVAAVPIKKDENYLPDISMVIPAYNEADVIRRKLQNTLAIDYPPEKFQILVIDDGSGDGTPDIVREFPRVTLIQQTERGGKPGALNRGFAESNGEVVVMSDASPDYEPDALRKLVRSFADPCVGIVVGELLLWDEENAVAKPAGLYWKYEAAIRRWESKTGSTVAVHGNMFAIRRHLFDPLPTDVVNDEFSIAMNIIRKGYRVIYEPEAISYDDASGNMSDEFKRRSRINAGRFQALFNAGYLTTVPTETAFRLFSHKLLRALSPVFMGVVAVTNLLLAVGKGSWIYRLLFAGQLGFYGSALAGWYAEKSGTKIKLVSVPYYFVSSNLAALVGLSRWVRGKQRVTWQKRQTQVGESETGVHS
jgi:poly-beta-1,6-N-acetyl-D-glucosamine synthase